MAVAVHSPSADGLLPASLSFFLGLRDQQPLITEATNAEQTLKQNLRAAYEDYGANRNNQSAVALKEAITAAIGQLEREYTIALKHVQTAHQRSNLDHSDNSLLSGLVAAWFGSSETAKESHYSEIADKAALNMQELIKFRDTLTDSSLSEDFASSRSHARRLLQTNSTSSPPITREQYYCYPLGACGIDQLSGLVLKGEDAMSWTGASVAAADVNGDGFTDAIVAAFDKTVKSKVYVVFGSNRTFDRSLNLTSVTDGVHGFSFEMTNVVFSVSNAGDINGDDVDDLLVGAPPEATYTNLTSGSAYVIFGNKTTNVWGSGTISLMSLMDGTRGFMLQGQAAGDRCGSSVSPAGDVNDDGFDDIMVGASNASPSSKSQAGETYVIFGNSSAAWGNGILNVGNLMNGRRGFVLQGEAAGDKCGASVSAAGDMNGDGVDDLLVGSNGNRTYIVFGSRNGTIWGNGTLDISSLIDGQRGFALRVSTAVQTVRTAGDINGDGFADFVLGASLNVYIVFGTNSPTAWGAGIVDVWTLMNGVQGFVFLGSGASTGDVVVSNVGDINRDGLDDFMIGKSAAKKIYIVLGSRLAETWGTGILDLATHTSSEQGSVVDSDVGALSTAGDFNGDGFTGLLIGVPPSSTYVLLTNNFKWHFVANNLRIGTEQSVNLTVHNLNISDENAQQGASMNRTRFLISNIEHGFFSFVTSPSEVLTSFFMEDIILGRVQFVHTETISPQYRLCVVDFGLTIKMCSDAQVEFLGYPPSLINNHLSVNQGASSVLQASDLSASDRDSSPSELFFNISNLSHGNFTVYNPTTNTTSSSTVFTQQAVLDGRVQFSHDNTRHPPYFTVTVNDTKSETKAQAATITFNYAPELNLSSAITIDQGQPTILSPADISATDEETFEALIIIQAANLTAGHFAYVGSNFPITAFQQLSLITGGVKFVHDGSDVDPSFELCAFDGTLRSAWQLPQITLNHRPKQVGIVNDHIDVLQGEDFRFKFDSVRFVDDDENDTLTYRAQLKGDNPLPHEVKFVPPNQFSGNIPGVTSFNIELVVSDSRGLAISISFILSTMVPHSAGFFDIEKLYTSLSSVGGIGLTILAYLWLRRKIAIHRRKFPFVNHLRKALNLEYYDYTRFDGDAYKSKVGDFFQRLQWENPDFYSRLSPQEQKSFAVCVAEILTKRGLVVRSDLSGGLFGVCCFLNVGWPNELKLNEFEAQTCVILEEALSEWKNAAVAEKEYKKPLNRWTYHSPSKSEKFRVFFCCAKPSTADRWRMTDNYTREGVALTELKTREGDI